MIVEPDGDELTLAEIQQEESRLLREFARICEANGLSYFLAYGTCLGAVRHGGPIPWDDDADVVMPRPDYERLRELAPMGEDCFLMPDGGEDYPWRFGKFVSARTSFRELMASVPDSYGVFVDVFPLDGVPERGAARHYGAVSRWYRVYQYAYHFDFSLPAHHGIKAFAKRIIGLAARIIPRSVFLKKIDGMARKFPYEGSADVANYFSPYPAGVEIMGRGFFERSEPVSYDGIAYPAPADTRLYLERLYGKDWMTPVKREMERHGYAWWRRPHGD